MARQQGSAPDRDPDHHRRVRRRGLPDLRPAAVRNAFRRFHTIAEREEASRERDTLEPPVRDRLRASG
jgi:hypothetical protein